MVALDNAVVQWLQIFMMDNVVASLDLGAVACVAQIVHCSCISHCSLGIRRVGW
jgi:hypothetical protein